MKSDAMQKFAVGKAKELILKYETSNPYELADCLNTNIIECELHEEICGFYSLYKRNKFLVINSNLDDYYKKFVVAHELGHSVLHPKMNTQFLKEHTWLSVDRHEHEANAFAVTLLTDGCDLEVNETKAQYCSRNHLPQEVVDYLSV